MLVTLADTQRLFMSPCLKSTEARRDEERLRLTGRLDCYPSCLRLIRIHSVMAGCILTRPRPARAIAACSRCRLETA